MNYDLAGLRVLNTRPLGQAAELSALIHAANGVSVELPTLEIKPTPLIWIQELPDLAQIDQALFTSANAVRYFYQGLDGVNWRWPKSIPVTAIGQGTVGALAKAGWQATYWPTIADSEHLLALPNLIDIATQNILLIKGCGGRELLAQGLKARTASLITIEVYQRDLPKKNWRFTDSIWHQDAVDIILFTSQDAMHNLFALFSPAARDWLCSKPCLVLSARLAKAAAGLGVRRILTSCYHDILDSLQGFVHDSQR